MTNITKSSNIFRDYTKNVRKCKNMMPKLFKMIKDKEITKEQIGKDIIAGIIVAIIALPLSIALGISSGVTPEKGLITAIVAGFFISFCCNYIFYNSREWYRWINNSNYNGWSNANYYGGIKAWFIN